MPNKLDDLKLTDEEIAAVVSALVNDANVRPSITHSIRKKYVALRDAGFYHTAAVLNGALEKLEGRAPSAKS